MCKGQGLAVVVEKEYCFGMYFKLGPFFCSMEEDSLLLFFSAFCLGLAPRWLDDGPAVVASHLNNVLACSPAGAGVFFDASY